MTEKLTIGSAAPALAVTRWLVGEPVSVRAGVDHPVLVLEFFVSWCGPCVDGIPYLTQLQTRLGDQGLRVAAVSPRDNKNTEDEVEHLVAARRDAIDFSVGWDGDRVSYKAFVRAAGEHGFPTFFVIDREGRIAWIGHSIAEVSNIVTHVLDGTHDLIQLHERYTVGRKLEERKQAEDWRTVADCAAKLIRINPQTRRRGSRSLRHCERSERMPPRYATRLAPRWLPWRSFRARDRSSPSAGWSWVPVSLTTR